MRIVSYNVENLSRFDDSRVKRLIEEISKLLESPDVIVLHEIMDDSGVEDDGEVSASIFLSYLIGQIELKSGIAYGFIDNPPNNDRDGGIEGGNIRSVVLYRKDTIKVIEKTIPGLPQNPTRIGTEDWPFSSTRKPLMVLLEYKDYPFLLVAPHLTSRGADTPLFGARQPIQKPEEGKRIAQADLIFDELQKFHLNNPDVPIILAGDLNDDPWSETINILKGGLLFDLSDNLPPNERFSYILDGNAIQIDHILAYLVNNWKATIKISHLNSILDYSLQSSDHDPVLAEITIP